jgi:hypothetical protein
LIDSKGNATSISFRVVTLGCLGCLVSSRRPRFSGPDAVRNQEGVTGSPTARIQETPVPKVLIDISDKAMKNNCQQKDAPDQPGIRLSCATPKRRREADLYVVH